MPGLGVYAGRMRLPTLLTAVSGLCAVALSGCAGTLIVQPAPSAAAPDCATVMLRLPDRIDDLAQRKTSAQATTAWGDPAGAVLRCGMEPPAPTTKPCVSVSGVDWISLEQSEESWKFVSFGRDPAVEVLVDPRKASGANVLNAVSPAVAALHQQDKCQSAEDIGEDGTPVRG